MEHVKMAHIWQACCDLWPDMKPRNSHSRSGKDVTRRNAFILAARHYGYSYRQIAPLLYRNNSTIVYSVRVAREKRETDAVFALSVEYIIKQALEVAGEPTPREPEPTKKRSVSQERELAGRVSMIEGSQELLAAIVREHAHFFAGFGDVKEKLSPELCNQEWFCSAHKISHGIIAA